MKINQNVMPNELNDAYIDCLKRKRQTVNAIKFMYEDFSDLSVLCEELNTYTYQIGKSIVFTLSKYNGIMEKYTAYREVFAADFRDRIVHHLLINRILPLLEQYEFTNSCFACREGKGTLYGVKKLYHDLSLAISINKQCYIMKCDLHNCFNMLPKELIYTKFEHFLNNYMHNDNLEFNLKLLQQILYHCPQHTGNYIRKQAKDNWKTLPYEKSMFHCDDMHGIAVGNLTSQIFANFYLSALDHFILEQLGYVFYGRYVDDFYIIGFDKQKMLSDYKLICQFVSEELQLEVNRNKFYIQHYSKGVKFTGYFVNKNGWYLSKTTMNKFKHFLYIENKNMYIKFGKYNRVASYMYMKTFIATYNSYAGMLYNTSDSQWLFKHISDYPWVQVMIQYTCVTKINGTISFNKEMKLLYRNFLLYGTKTRKIKHKPI